MSETLPRTGRPARAKGVKMRWDRARERHVLLGPEAVVVLNPTGADILELCDGQRAITDIVEELRARYGRDDGTDIEEEVVGFLTRLAARRWVVIGE